MNLLTVLKATFNGAWRRRVLMATPLLILIPLSVAAAVLWPPKYEANALVLLQEYNGLSGDAPSYVRAQDMRDKIKSLEALIRSEFILRRIWKEHSPDGANQEPSEKDLDEYRKHLSVAQEGNQFVLLSLTGNKREGLGNELGAILASLFESLLSANNTSLNAPTFLRLQRREDLARIEGLLRATPAPSVDGASTGLTEKRAALAEIVAQKETTERAIEQARAALSGELAASPTDAALKDAPASEIAESLRGRLSNLENDPNARPFNAIERAERTDQLKQLINAATGLAAMGAKQEQLAQTERQMRTEVTLTNQQLTQRTLLQQQADDIRRRYGLVQNQNISVATGADIQLLTAPAQIQVIDTPKDPQRPNGSKLQILLAGIAAALAMSLALGILAEQLDGRLRGPDMLRTATALPVIAEFAMFRDGNAPAGAQQMQSRGA